MNRNKAKELLPIIEALSKGRVIQSRHIKGGASLWYDVETPNFDNNDFDYRIKPEPKYRPFANAEECWQEMLKHEPFGWVKCKEDGSLGLITLIINEASIYINGIGSNSERTMRGFTFADGTTFGILEEE